jgi:phosphatidylglycerophosphatase A
VKPVLRALATGFGTGFFPIAPGTAGSLLAVALWIWVPLPLGQDGSFGPGVAVFLVAAALIGVPASRIGEEEFGEDGGPIVWDEVVGQWITLAAVPVSPAAAILGFLLFRAFDIFKPWPAGVSQEWPHGWGVMADDVFAGLYARLALHFLLPLVAGVLG